MKILCYPTEHQMIILQNLFEADRKLYNHTVLFLRKHLPYVQIHKYKKAEGASFQADASNPEGTYNVITGSTGRLADLDKEFRELQIKIAEMQPEKSISYFTQNGVSLK